MLLLLLLEIVLPLMVKLLVAIVGTKLVKAMAPPIPTPDAVPRTMLPSNVELLMVTLMPFAASSTPPFVPVADVTLFKLNVLLLMVNRPAEAAALFPAKIMLLTVAVPTTEALESVISESVTNSSLVEINGAAAPVVELPTIVIPEIVTVALPMA